MQHTKDVIEFHRVSAPCQDVSEAMMSVKYTPDSMWVTTACSSGLVQFYGQGNHNATFRPFGLGGQETGLTGISFCKDYDDEGNENAYWMSASSSNGLVRLFEVQPGKTYKSLGDAEEKNEVLTTAISGDRRFVVSGGADKILRVYHVTPEGLKLGQSIEQGIDEHGAPSVGHGSRIFCIKFLPNPSTFLSAGWESSVLLYDIRASSAPQRQFQGPRISGEGVDYMDNLLACASDRLTNQLQFFDIGSGKKIGEDVSFSSSLYSVKLSQRKGNVVAWTTGTKENIVACVDVKTRQVTTSITNIEEAMFTLDVNEDRPSQIYVGGGRAAAYRVNVIE